MTDTATTTDRAHPISGVVSGFEDALKDVRDVPTWSMPSGVAVDTLLGITRLRGQLADVEARVIDRVDQAGVAMDAGASSTANWLAVQTRQTRAAAHRLARFATALTTEAHEPVRLALADGELLVDQAEVIIAAIDALPDDLDPNIRADAQGRLIGYAAVHDAKALRILGKRILEVVAPEVGEAHEAKVLEREEREAEAAASFRMVEDGHGKWHGRFTLPTLQGAMLKKALMAYAAPKHRTSVDGQAPEPGRPSNHRMGQAFMEYVSRYPVDRLPNAGGMSASVVVTMDLDTLMGGLKAAQLDTGHRISPGLARKLACEAGIIPAVLGGRSEVLDLGRRRRFHTKAQRIALAIEQGGCTAEGCDAPPAMTHVHHDQTWADGGATDLKNGRLLCWPHHARAHDPAYEMSKLPEGKVRFHRRT
jgi:hypothetical protein